MPKGKPGWVILLMLLIGLTIAPATAAARQAADPTYRWVNGGTTVEGRNFYLFTLMREISAARALLLGSARLRAIAEVRSTRVAAADRCSPRPRCIVDAYIWRTEEIDAVAAALNEPALVRALVGPHLRASGAFERHAGLEDEAFLAAAWRDAAAGVNHILAIYGNGDAPRYPNIDSIGFDVASPEFAALIQSLHATLGEQFDRSSLFFEPSLRFALNLLYLNDREDAARFEPLETGLNAPVIQHLRSVDWRRYRYTALIVPGDGPDTPDAALGSFGKLRLMTVVSRWRDGLAPVIIVSGGNVHPAHTSFNEGLEMRRELMERYGVPAEAIMVEPHARHTTTNLRNVARLMFRAGIPFDRDALIVTSESQSTYIESETFAARSRSELGYVPAQLGRRISAFDLPFRPVLASLHRDSSDPLDP